jgi:hypothetical protein
MAIDYNPLVELPIRLRRLRLSFIGLGSIGEDWRGFWPLLRSSSPLKALRYFLA